MYRFAFAFAVAGCAASPRPTPSTSSHVPLTLTARAALTVPVVIAGTSLTFQLDTGASETTITRATWKTLGLPHGEVVHAEGAGGAVEDTEMVPHVSLRVGDRDVHDLSVAIIDLVEEASPVDGVLGQDVLARYIADIDIPTHRMTLHAKDATAWRTPDLVAIPYTMTEEGLIRIAGSVDTTPVAVILDLGAGATIASSKAAPGATPAGAQAVGADGNTLAMGTVDDRKVSIGALALAPKQLFVADLPVFAAFGLADQPAVILGMDRLASHRIVIDPTAKQIYISR